MIDFRIILQLLGNCVMFSRETKSIANNLINYLLTFTLVIHIMFILEKTVVSAGGAGS